MGRIRALLLSFLGGAVFLSFEIYWVRIFSFATKSRPYTFALVLGIYLTGLALGAMASRLFYLPSRRPSRQVLGWLYLGSAVLCYLTIPLTVWFATLKFYGYWFGLVPLFLAACLFGGIFPLLVKASSIRDEEAGSAVALLSGANIMGSLAGSLAAGFYLIDVLPLAQASALSAFSGLLCALLCFSVAKRTLRAALPVVLSLIAAVGILSSNGILHREMYKKLMFMPRHVVKKPFKEVIENRSGVICLSEDGMVFGDGAYDGHLNTDFYPKVNAEIELAYLSFLFHPEPRRILVVGLATGAWTQVLAHGPGVESVTAVEINPGYLELIEKSPEVSSLLVNPKVDIVIDDGRRWLDRNPEERFDYIILNTTFHWRSGATNLLSREFMSLVKEHLNPDGVVLVNTTGSAEVAATAADVFSHLAGYGIYLAVSEQPLAADKERFTRIMEEYTVDGRPVLDLSVPEAAEELAYYLKLDYSGAGERWRQRASKAGIITDDNMITEF